MMNATLYTDSVIEMITEDLTTIIDELRCVTTIDEARGLGAELESIINSLEEDCYDADDVMADLKNELRCEVENTMSLVFDDFEV